MTIENSFFNSSVHPSVLLLHHNVNFSVESDKKNDTERSSVHPLIARLQSTLHHLTNFIIICIIVTILVLYNYQPSFTGNLISNRQYTIHKNKAEKIRLTNEHQ